MAAHRMTFSELHATLTAAGFDLVDEGGLIVGQEAQQSLEENELLDDPVEVRFREQPEDSSRAILADVQASDQLFYVVGDIRNAQQLQTLLEADNRLPSMPPTGEGPHPRP